MLGTMISLWLLESASSHFANEETEAQVMSFVPVSGWAVTGQKQPAFRQQPVQLCNLLGAGQTGVWEQERGTHCRGESPCSGDACLASSCSLT